MTLLASAAFALTRMVGATPLSLNEDDLLAERVRSTGDREAYGELVRRFRPRVTVLAQRMLGSQPNLPAAEDIAQEAFVSAYINRLQFQPGAAFRPWLYRIVVNKCLDQLRKRQRQPGILSLEDADRFEGSDVPCLDHVLAAERNEQVQAAVAQLPEKHRAVFLLRYVDDLSYEEIAAVTDLPIGTVKTHLFRARRALKNILQTSSFKGEDTCD